MIDHNNLSTRICGQDEITNDFTFQEITQVLEHQESFRHIFKGDND